MAKQRRRLVFYGTVQGVGFRYRAQYLARLLSLTGYVNNRWDGAVELEAEGEAADIDELIARLNTAPYIEITNMSSEIFPLKNDSSFRVEAY